MADKKQARCFFAILGFASLYVFFGFLYALDRRDTDNVLYEIFRNKVHAADQASSKPRILLAGGSNVVWGFRSREIEQITGLPTFNLGLLHEAYEPGAMRELVLSAAQAGDIIVYVSAAFWNTRATDPRAAKSLLQVAGLLRAEDPWQDFRWALDRYWAPFPEKSTIIRSLGVLYDRYVLRKRSVHSEGLNDKGDILSCHKQGPVAPSDYVDPPNEQALLDTLQIFQQRLKQRGASLVLAFPYMLVARKHRLWLENYGSLWKKMHAEFTVATLDLADSVTLQESLFCDSGLHLGNEEAVRHSRRLGQYLAESILKKPGYQDRKASSPDVFSGRSSAPPANETL